MGTTSSTGGAGATTGRRTVVGVFDGPNHAEMALNELKNGGFRPDQVSVVARDSGETKDMVESTGMGAAGAGTGALLGGITGGIVGWLVGIGALAIPGIGPVVAAGALASTLTGAAVGAAAGGLLGALIDLGIPEEEARGYEESVRQGRILLTVHADSDEQAHQARQIFDRHGGADVRGYGVSSDYDEWSRTSGGDRDRDEVGGGAGGGAAAGAVSGGVTGAVVGGPVGAGVGAVTGAAIGAAGGAATDDDDDDDTTTTGRGTTGTTGTGTTDTGTTSGDRTRL